MTITRLPHTSLTATRRPRVGTDLDPLGLDEALILNPVVEHAGRVCDSRLLPRDTDYLLGLVEETPDGVELMHIRNQFIWTGSRPYAQASPTSSLPPTSARRHALPVLSPELLGHKRHAPGVKPRKADAPVLHGLEMTSSHQSLTTTNSSGRTTP